MDTLQHHLCIVLARGDGPAVRSLAEQLASLDCRIEQYASPAEAFARLCLCQRAYVTANQTESRVGTADRPAMVVVDADDWSQWPQMLSASDRHMPLAMWQWRDDELTMLREGAPPHEVVTGNAAVMPEPRPGGAPQLRLSEPFLETGSPAVAEWSDPLPALDDPSGIAEHNDRDDRDDDDVRLSSQEIDMLLDTRSLDDDRPRRDGEQH